MNSVYITGLGIVSSLGFGVDEHFNKLKNEESGIRLNNSFSLPVFTAAVSLSNSDLKTQLQIPQEKVVSRTALLGLMAAKEAWGNLELDGKQAFINGSTVGGMDLSEHYFNDIYQDRKGDATLVTMHDLGSVTDFIADNLASFEHINTISTACSSSANAIMIGGQMIKSGLYDRVLVGGTDALCEFTIQGFKSLMVYSDEWCQPFDENRKGLNLGEGAAYLVLESEASMKKSGRTAFGKLVGWANANDAYHNTGTSPDGMGAQKSINEALEIAGLKKVQIDYINAHGTATQNNDSSELAAMQAVFENGIPPYSSTKAFTGHTLAAAGAIEAVFSLKAIQENYAFANINNQQNIDASGSLITKGVSKQIDAVLSNSFGFGGNCTSLIFTK